MSVRPLALVVAAFVALGSLTLAVSPVSARSFEDIALTAADGIPNVPGFRVSLAVH